MSSFEVLVKLHKCDLPGLANSTCSGLIPVPLLLIEVASLAWTSKLYLAWTS